MPKPTRKPLTYGTLPDLIETVATRRQSRAPRPFLYCRTCGGEYSAHRGDYFMQHPDRTPKCCGRPLRLVKRETLLREVEP